MKRKQFVFLLLAMVLILQLLPAAALAEDSAGSALPELQKTVNENDNKFVELNAVSIVFPDGEPASVGDTVVISVYPANKTQKTIKNYVITDSLGNRKEIAELAPNFGQNIFPELGLAEAAKADAVLKLVHVITFGEVSGGKFTYEATASGFDEGWMPVTSSVTVEIEVNSVYPEADLTASDEEGGTEQAANGLPIAEAAIDAMAADANAENVAAGEETVKEETDPAAADTAGDSKGEDSETVENGPVSGDAGSNADEPDGTDGNGADGVTETAGQDSVSDAEAKAEDDVEFEATGVEREISELAVMGDPEDPEPKLTVSQAVVSTPKEGETYDLGETVRYQITVENTGNVTLDAVKVKTDAVPEEGTGYKINDDGQAEIVTLEVGQKVEISAQHQVTGDDIGKQEAENTAAAVTQYGETSYTFNAETLTVKTVAPDPKLSMTQETPSKPANGEAYVPGETIRYKITVKNEGNVTVTDLTVSPDPAKTVKPPEDGETSGEETDPEEKVIEYTVEGKTAKIEALAPGETAEIYAEYTVTDSDADSGQVSNTVTAEGTAPDRDGDPSTVTAETDSDIEPVAKSDLSITIAWNSFPVDHDFFSDYGIYVTSGDIIQYTATVTNEGTVSLYNVEVSFGLAGAVIQGGTGYHVENGKAIIDELAPGESLKIIARYKVTEDDAVIGVVENDASAIGQDGESKVVSAYSDSCITTILKKLTITANDVRKIYDGKDLIASGYTYEGLKPGHVILEGSVTVTGSRRYVGTAESVLSNSAKILNAAYEDVTDQYVITYENGTLTVDPKPLTITASNKEKEYIPVFLSLK